MSFLLRKPADLLLNISQKVFISELSEKTNMTFYYTSRVVDVFANAGLVNKSCQGRRCFLTLTKKGEKIVKYLRAIKDVE